MRIIYNPSHHSIFLIELPRRLHPREREICNMVYAPGVWPHHPREDERLKLLHSFNVLDTGPETAFDRITALAKISLDVPICIISLVDFDRQWFKSCIGLDVQQTGRDVAFCAYAIMPDAPELFIVNDATLDERFANNPLVTGPPHIRFYAGAPLLYEGEKLGTLCGIDTRPRPAGLTAGEKTSMELMAAMVVDQLVAREANKHVAKAHMELCLSSAQLNAKHQELTGLIDSANAPIFAVDAGLVFTVWNHKLAELTSVSSEEVLGQHLDTVLAMVYPAKEFDVSMDESLMEDSCSDNELVGVNSPGAYQIKTALMKSLKGEQCALFDLELRTLETKRQSHLQVSAQPKKNASGEVVGVVCVGEDVLSRQKVLREELRNHQLVATNAAKDAFLASMSHEMRTPLNGLLGMLQLAIASNDLATANRFVKQAQNSGKLLLNLINDIFDIARIEAGEIRIEAIDFDLKDTLDEIIGLVTSKAVERGLKLSMSLDPKLEERAVHGDATRIQQVILNLLWNSLKYTNEGSVHLHVTHLQEEDEEILVSFEVVDTGIGIPTEHQASLFQRFSVAAKQHNREGAGLGLPICSELVSLMSGEISIDSNPEVRPGTTVTVVLPLRKGSRENIISVEELSRNCEESAGQKKLSILVVEDNDYNQDVCKEILEFLGHKVTLAANGEEGYFALITEHSEYDLVLMDCDMPVMNGFESTQAIRKWEAENCIQPGMRIIAVTAHAMSGDKQRCFDAGMDDYLTKPILLPQLRQKLMMHSDRNPTRPSNGSSKSDSFKARTTPEAATGATSKSPVPPRNMQDNPLVASLKERDGSSMRRPKRAVSSDNRLSAVAVSKLLDNFGGNLQLAKRTLEMFDGKLIFDQMPSALVEKDFDRLKRLAHQAKGQFGYIAAATAYDMASRVENGCKKLLKGEDDAPAYSDLDNLVDELRQETSHVVRSVHLAMREVLEQM
ncbi:hypothetical protein AB1Y20_020252 [Prymnesium parvum]|uniref:histidine kinase n=1 Tax=Prymnesium parvum TaxID=97485 RepID=A0AB34JSY6_PRYPA